MPSVLWFLTKLMILMKPIHNCLGIFPQVIWVVIPHKVNDFNETNSQHHSIISIRIIVVIPHKVNDFNETNSLLWFLTKLMILMKPIHNMWETTKTTPPVVIPHKVNDFNETNSQHRQVKDVHH